MMKTLGASDDNESPVCLRETAVDALHMYFYRIALNVRF